MMLALILSQMLAYASFGALVVTARAKHDLDSAKLSALWTLNDQWTEQYRQLVDAHSERVEFYARALLASTSGSASDRLARSEQAAKVDPNLVVKARIDELAEERDRLHREDQAEVTLAGME